MRTSLHIASILCAVLLMSGDIGGSAPLRLQVSPAVSRAPGRLTVRVTVASAPENRSLQVVAVSPDYYRSSSVQIDGKDGTPLNVFEFTNLPTGLYEITGVLVGVNGPRATVQGIAKVEPSVGSPQ
jgi:hypothetical protein